MAPAFVALVLAVLLFRLAISATLLQTYFNPDEYWQGPEIAHRLVYGYGYETWEWRAAIRSYAHPTLLALAYRAAELVPGRPEWLVIEAPRILHAALAAVADVHVSLLARRLFGPAAARWTISSAPPAAARCPRPASRPVAAALTPSAHLFCQMTLWFNAFALQRTFSNSLEAVLTAVAASLWPWPGVSRTPHWRAPFLLFRRSFASRRRALTAARRRRRDRALAAGLAALAFVVRPTAVLLWVPLGAAHLLRASDPARFVGDVALASGTVLSATALLDRALYGRWVLPPLEFFRFNVLRGGSAAYGTHPWHWYLSQGGPAVLGTQLPLVLAGARLAGPGRRWPATAAALAAAALSCFAHKEFRFLLPLIPLVLPYAGLALERAARAAYPPAKKEGEGGGEGEGEGRRRPHLRLRRAGLALLVFLLVGTNAGAAGYLGLVHQRGAVGVVDWLRRASPPPTAVHFLTPCHSTPHYASLHRPIPMRILTCDPNWQGLNRTWRQEQDAFYAQPLNFLRGYYEGGAHAIGQARALNAWRCLDSAVHGPELPGAHPCEAFAGKPLPPEPVPSHLVLFDDGILPIGIKPFLDSFGFRECARLRHADYVLESRLGKEVLVLCRRVERERRAPRKKKGSEARA
eukprot:tig00020904_g15264.t1